MDLVKRCLNEEYQRSKNEMPELPEVQTIHRQLAETLTEEIDLPNHPVYFIFPDNEQVWDLSVDWIQVGNTPQSSPIIKIQRKGKFMCWYTNEFKVLLHLRMSGRLAIVRTTESSPEEIVTAYKHVKALFTFHNVIDPTSSFRVIFTDTRGFGICQVAPTSHPHKQHERLSQLGLDPFYPEEWTLEKFKLQLLSIGGNLSIGTHLLRQEVFAGIGNIYRSEILHQASVSPYRQPHSLVEYELKRLFEATTEIMNEAIYHGGCSMLDSRSSYRDLHGNKGRYAYYLQVYQRQGLSCHNCGGTIFMMDLEKHRRIYFCPDCQA